MAGKTPPQVGDGGKKPQSSSWWGNVWTSLDRLVLRGRTFGAFLVTLGCFLMVAWVLRDAIANIDTAPKVATKTEGPVDAFENSKTLLAIVFPILTAALGFWFGSDGKTQAQQQASDSAAAAKEAEAKRAKANDQTAALLAASTHPEDLRARAIDLFPASFSD